MLEDYFKNSNTLHDMRLGPVGPYLDEISEKLKSEHYSRGTIRSHLQSMAHLSRYLMWKGVESVGDGIARQIDDFLKNHLPNCNCKRTNRGTFAPAAPAMRRLLDFLKEKNIIRTAVKALAPDSIDGILARYREYLAKIRALAASSIVHYSYMAELFLSARLSDNHKLELSSITGKDVMAIYETVIPMHPSFDWHRSSSSCLRDFLRFLHWERICPENLAGIVPPVRKWKMAEVPEALTEDKLTQLLRTPDRNTPLGKRDYTILVMLATLGMRASEIVNLEFKDIHWRQRMIVIPGVKTRREREMPLPDAVFEALYDYIKNARPQCDSKRVFLRSTAPIRGFASSPAVTTIVSRYTDKSGIDRKKHKGSHMLRHTFATLLINRGVPLKTLSDMLGHNNLDTTRIYSKVDLHNLRKIVCEFPECNRKDK